MDVLQARRAKRQQDALQKVAFPGFPEPEADVGLFVARLVAKLAPPPVLPEQAVESVLAQPEVLLLEKVVAQRVLPQQAAQPQASPSVALRVTSEQQERAPLVPSKQAQWMPQAQQVWQPAEPAVTQQLVRKEQPVPRASPLWAQQVQPQPAQELPQDASVQPWLQLPSPLFLSWQQLPLQPQLPPVLIASCELFPRRPRESSSSASSFPLRHTPPTGQ
jgi:hypothetical protein